MHSPGRNKRDSTDQRKIVDPERIKMDLLRSVQVDNLEKIRKLIAENGISANSKCLDYTILNAALEKGRKDVAKFLLDRKCSVNKTIDSPPADTPLHYAVKLEDMELVKKLLDKKAAIMTPNAEGDSPLHLAFMRRNDKIVDVMFGTICHTKVVNASNKRRLTHMHIACARNNAEVVKSFLESGVEVESRVSFDSTLWAGYTPLHFAVDFGSLDVVKVLLNAGANIFSRDANEVMPIHLARAKYQNASLLNYFLLGDDKDNQLGCDNKMSHFHTACMMDDPVLVKKFVDHRAAVNNPISKSAVFCPLYSPLHFAVESNCRENVQLLLKSGAEVEQQNEYYMTSLHLALYNDDYKAENSIVDLLYSALVDKSANRIDLNGLNYFHIACTRNDIDLVTNFLENGEDVNSEILYNLRKFSNYTPLHFAVRYGHREMAELLIKHGANLNKCDNGMDGTPLHLAFEGEHEQIIDMLLQEGARTDAIRPFDDRTMLHILIGKLMDKSCCDEVNNVAMRNYVCKLDSKAETYIKLLLKDGCDINARDSNGNTALHLACTKLKDGITYVRILLDFGADINLENVEEETPFDMAFHDVYRNNAESYMTLYHHVKALKALGIDVNPRNDRCCDKLIREQNECERGSIYFSEEKLAIKHKQRLDEVSKLRVQKIDKRTSLFDVLFDDSKKLAIHCQNTIFKNIIDSKHFKKQYPTYGYMIQLQFEKGLDNVKADSGSASTSATSRSFQPDIKRRRIR